MQARTHSPAVALVIIFWLMGFNMIVSASPTSSESHRHFRSLQPFFLTYADLRARKDPNSCDGEHPDSCGGDDAIRNSQDAWGGYWSYCFDNKIKRISYTEDFGPRCVAGDDTTYTPRMPTSCWGGEDAYSTAFKIRMCLWKQSHSCLPPCCQPDY